MKKILIAVGAVASLIVGGVVVVRATSGTPEIDRANATLSLQGRLAQAQCTGEDGVPYLTLKGAYSSGVETQYVPDPTNYDLSGKVTIGGIVWTINLSTKRGVFLGTIALHNSTGALSYKGTIWLITDGLPSSGSAVPARGWINAPFLLPDDGVPTSTSPNDDRLLANVEFVLAPTGASGQFGTSPPNPGGPVYPDFSVVTNVAPPLDGTC